MKIFTVNFSYGIEIIAKDSKQALEIAENSLDQSMREEFNCFEVEIQEVNQ